MKCTESMLLMNAYIDGEISERELKRLESHLASCEACTVEFEELKFMKSTMEEMPMKALPVGFEEELHFNLLRVASSDLANAVVQEETVWHKLKRFLTDRRVLVGVATFAVIGFAFVFKGGLPVSDLDMAYEESDRAPREMMKETLTMGEDKGEDADYGDITADAEGATVANVVAEEAPVSTSTRDAAYLYRTERMIIRNASIGLEVEDYDGVKWSLVEKVDELGGYVENEETWRTKFDAYELKHGEMQLRVPVESYDVILELVKSLGRVDYENVSANDITKQYRDTAGLIENLKITETRLRELLKEAVSVEDVLTIENELTRIRSQINGYEVQMKNWETLVDMTTIHLQVQEVKSLEPRINPIDDNIWEKATKGLYQTINGIKSLFEEFIIAVVAYFPIWLPVLIVVGGSVVVWKRKKVK